MSLKATFDGAFHHPSPSAITTDASSAPVFILAGQSNMAGRCDAADADVPHSVKHPMELGELHLHGGVHFCMCWDNDSNFGPENENGGISNGEWRDLQVQPSPGLPGVVACFGPELALAAALGPRLYRRGVRRAHFVKFAMGSTNLHSNWNPSNRRAERRPSEVGHYRRFIEFCRTTLSRLEDQEEEGEGRSAPLSHRRSARLAGMFWLQGESDSSRAGDANSYLSNLAELALSVRGDLDVVAPDELPIVVSPVVWHRGKRVGVVNGALRDAGAGGGVPCCICIDPIDPAFGVQSEDAGVRAGHLTGRGVCDVGRRMGEAFPLP